MDILNEIKNRRSCRSYQDTIPKKEEINKVIEAGLYAASGMNLQTGIIVSITNKEIIHELSLLNRSIMGVDRDPFYGAPVVLLVLVKKHRNAVYDGSCMIENMMLEASSIGLGSCWIHRLKQEIEMDEGKREPRPAHPPFERRPSWPYLQPHQRKGDPKGLGTILDGIRDRPHRSLHAPSGR